MKKTLLFAATLLLIAAAPMTFADISASVYMTGSLYGTNGFVLNNENQKDADLLLFSIAGDVSGAEFRLWSNLDADSSVVHLRHAKLWWKPISELKLSVGKISQTTYTEQLDWWKTPTGASLSQASDWYNRWSNASTGDSYGIQLDIDPMPGLSLTTGVYPGIGNAFGVLDEDADDDEFYDPNTAWGIHAKYNIDGFGSVLGAYRDDGFDDFKIGRVGFDVNAVPNLYAFLSGIFYWDDHTIRDTTLATEEEKTAPDDDGMMLRGLAIDNYIKYTMDKITLEARFPLTLRLTDIDGDDSYLTWRVRAKYAMDPWTPYLNLETLDWVPINLAEPGDTFAISIRPGVEWSIENIWGDLGVQIDVPAAVPEDQDIVWSIPFRMRVSW